MKELDKLKKELKKIGNNIFLAYTPGYDSFIEEFLPNIWRINLFVDMEKNSLEQLVNIKKSVTNIFKNYNIIISAHHYGCIEYWYGDYKENSKNLLLFIFPITRAINANKIVIASMLIGGGELISGKYFLDKITKSVYEWYNLFDLFVYNYTIPYLYLKEDLNPIFRIGMLKSYFMKCLVAALYTKGVFPENKEKIKWFFKEKFGDDRMLEIIDNFYNNDYSEIDSAVKDSIYFTNKLFRWEGFNP